MARTVFRAPLSMAQRRGDMDSVPTWTCRSTASLHRRGADATAFLSSRAESLLMDFMTAVEPSAKVLSNIRDTKLELQRRPGSQASSLYLLTVPIKDS